MGTERERPRPGHLESAALREEPRSRADLAAKQVRWGSAGACRAVASSLCPRKAGPCSCALGHPGSVSYGQHFRVCAPASLGRRGRPRMAGLTKEPPGSMCSLALYS